MPRFLLTLAGLFAAAFLSWLALRPTEPAEPSNAGGPEQAPDPLSVSPVDLASSHPGTMERHAPDQVEARTPVEPSPATAPVSSAPVQGRLEIVDLLGRLLPPQSGLLRFAEPEHRGTLFFEPSTHFGSGWSQPQTATVTAGRFAPDPLTFNDSLRAVRFESETLVALGRSDTLDGPLQASNRDLIIRLQQVEEVSLQVLSSETGLHLSGVEVKAIERAWILPSNNPGAHQTRPLFASASSPIRLPLQQLLPPVDEVQQIRLLLRAPGHAWQYFSTPFPPERAPLVELHPSATLELTLNGPVQQLRPSFHLVEDPFQEIILQSASIEERILLAEGLPPGTYSGRLTAGADAFRSPLLASAEIELKPGRTTSHTLNFEPLGTVERVVVSGVLSVPAAWPKPDPTLELRAVDLPADGLGRESLDRTDFPAGSTAGPWIRSFEFAAVYPGEHLLILPALGWEMTVDVPETGLHGLAFEVPPPCDIQLEFVDALSGDPLQPVVAMLKAGSGHGPPDGGQSWIPARREGAAWTVTCPQGPMEIFAVVPRYSATNNAIEVQASGEHHRVELRPLTVLHLLFELDGKPCTPPADLLPEFLDPAGEPYFSWTHDLGTERQFGLEPNTTYEVRFPKPNGFDPIHPFALETGDQTRLEHTIQLVPIR